MNDKDIKTLPNFPNREESGEFVRIAARIRVDRLQAGHYYRPFLNDICEVKKVTRDKIHRYVRVVCFFWIDNNPDLGIYIHFFHEWDEVICLYRKVFKDGRRNRERVL